MPGSIHARAFGLRAGDRIGRYECVAPLAMGGMAEVYLARHRGAAGFEKRVVIKRVLPHLAVDADFVDMFLKEARLAAALDHPGIAQVIDFGHDGRDYYMVLEYVQGHDLRAVLKEGVRREGALPLPVALGIAVEATAALHHAHQQRDEQGQPLGIVHRDVSPSNILLAHTGAVKVIDFGIARAIGISRTTRAGVVKGKAGYMSPEQCRDEPVDHRTDVFGLGIVLYEMTTGYRLFHASSDFAAMNKIAEGRFVPPREAVPDYPASLETIVLRCLATHPGDRFDSCDALRIALEGFAVQQRLVLSAAARAEVLERWLGPATLPVGDDPPATGLPNRDTGPRRRASDTAETIALGSAAASTSISTPRRSALLVAVTATVTGLAVWSMSGAQEPTPPSDPAPRPTSTPAEASAPPPDRPEPTHHPTHHPQEPQPEPTPPPQEPQPADPRPAHPSPSPSPAPTPESAPTTPAPDTEPAPAQTTPTTARRAESRSRSRKVSGSASRASPRRRKTLLPPSMRDP
ncbi:MAG: protein kinase [Myxococcota bacterium]